MNRLDGELGHVHLRKVQADKKIFQESKPVWTAVVEKEQESEQTAARFSPFQRGVCAGAHNKPARHFFLCQIQYASSFKQFGTDAVLQSVIQTFPHDNPSFMRQILPK